jgi:6-pyruvoyltetrahydropterin/6-carboxytetrahydropterin synthase
MPTRSFGSTRMMISTFKEFTFEAAHKIAPYSDLHGHTFKVEVSLTGEADPVFGWNVNLYELERHVDQIRHRLDHKYLNEVEGLEIPSLENVARWIWDRLDREFPGLERVVVRRGADGHAEGCVCHGPSARRDRRPASQLELWGAP